MSTENEAGTPNPSQPLPADESDPDYKSAAPARRHFNPFLLGMIAVLLLIRP